MRIAETWQGVWCGLNIGARSKSLPRGFWLHHFEVNAQTRDETSKMVSTYVYSMHLKELFFSTIKDENVVG